jgi:glycosyltransferase involved in cell wall biosynthesis
VNFQTRPADQVVVYVDERGDGPARARNNAVAQAETDYVAILDDDDEFLPNHLELTMRAARTENADLVYSWFEHVGWPEWTETRPDPLAVSFEGRLMHPFGIRFGPEQARHLQSYAFIPVTTVMRRSKFLEVGGYPEPGSPLHRRCDGLEDWAIELAMLDAGAKFVHVPYRTWRLHHGRGYGGHAWKPNESMTASDS